MDASNIEWADLFCKNCKCRIFSQRVNLTKVNLDHLKLIVCRICGTKGEIHVAETIDPDLEKQIFYGSLW